MSSYRNELQDILHKLRGVKKSGRGWVARCPAHDDSVNSLSIVEGSSGKVLLKCHAGCTFEDIIAEVGNPNYKSDNYDKKKKTVQKSVVKAYDYVDENGELLYQVARTAPKGFFQRKPGVAGGWLYNLDGVRRVLYRLPDLISTPRGATVFVVEGEKDSDRLWDLGFAATTNAGGAGKWLPEYCEQLSKFDCVVIVPDNDKPGREHAKKVGRSLKDMNDAQEVRILELPGLPEKGDVSDWLDAGGMADEFDVLASEKAIRIEDYVDSEEADELTLAPAEEPPASEAQPSILGVSEEPQAVEIERQILGLIIRDNPLVAQAVEMRLLESLFLAAHRHILSAMIVLYERDWLIDHLTIGEELRKRGVLVQCGDMEYLKSLKENIESDAKDLEHYIEIVKSKAQLRAMLRLSQSLGGAIREGAEGPEALKEFVERTVYEITDDNQREGFQKAGDIVNRVIERAQVLSTSDSEISGLVTGFVDFDEATSGLQKQDLILIAGRPSMGKTGFATNIAFNAAQKGNVVGLFSLEMSKDAVIARVLCSEARVDSTKFRNGRLSPEEWTRLSYATGAVTQSSLFIDDTPAISVLELRAKARRLAAEQKRLDLIVVDYLQLMSGSARRTESRQQEVSQISRDLKGLAKELDVPLVALSQLNRAPENRADPRPQLSDLRESGALEQDSDVVAFLFREEYYNQTDDNKGLAELIIAKQRSGPTKTVHLAWLKEFTRFENIFPVNELGTYGLQDDSAPFAI
jgi:replicative DNA helicase